MVILAKKPDMDTDHKHRFDGKEDRNYHQKPFDDNTDPLPQIDEASAKMADKNAGKPNVSPNGSEYDRKAEEDRSRG